MSAAAFLAEARLLLKVARPGFWLTSVWFYLLPLGGHDVLAHPPFWLGLFYIGFPLGMMIYGWNDVVDLETDRLNPRIGARPQRRSSSSCSLLKRPSSGAGWTKVGWPSPLPEERSCSLPTPPSSGATAPTPRADALVFLELECGGLADHPVGLAHRLARRPLGRRAANFPKIPLAFTPAGA